MSNEEKIMEAVKQLSPSGKVEILSYANIVLKAEQGIKKQYGIEQPAEDRKTA